MLRIPFLVVWASLAMTLAGPHRVCAETRGVVLLFDERVELPGMSRLDAEFVRTLQANSADPVEVYREQMDLSRFGSDTYKSSLRDFLRTKYADKKIDVVVAVMSPAFDFLSKYGTLIFPETPIVFCGLDRKQLGNSPLPPNWYGVLVKRQLAPTLDIVLRIHPKTREIVVVSGTSEFDNKISTEARTEFRAYDSRLTFTYISDLPFQTLLPILSHLPSDNVVFFTTLFQDGAGKPFTPHQALELISTAASVPVYASADDQYLGRGIVGGHLYSFASHGADTAKLVLRVLSGGAPSEAVSESTGSKTVFDWRQMQRWGVSERSLPHDAEIDFRESSLWRTYSWQISLILTVVVLEAGLISLLLYERRRRRYAEVQSQQRMSELVRVNRFSTAGELTASIAHEINQPLGAIRINAEAMALVLTLPSPDIDEIKEITGDILRDQGRASEVIRRLRSMLRKAPFELSDIDLNDIVRETEEFLFTLAVGRQAEFSNSLAPVPLPLRADRIQLQQVILNLIVNAMDAMSEMPQAKRKIFVRTTRIDGFVELSISDTGPGISSDKLKGVFEPFFSTKAHGMGIGLSIARTIVEAHNGGIWAENRATGGAAFRIKLPLLGRSGELPLRITSRSSEMSAPGAFRTSRDVRL
jgi:signal transduction histidine kinase